MTILAEEAKALFKAKEYEKSTELFGAILEGLYGCFNEGSAAWPNGAGMR